MIENQYLSKHKLLLLGQPLTKLFFFLIIRLDYRVRHIFFSYFLASIHTYLVTLLYNRNLFWGSLPL